VKIATFNVNDVNRRLANLLDWLAAAKPDVVCLQEIKCVDGRFPAAAIREAGYGAVWHGMPTWHGVAILARGGDPVLVRKGLPGDVLDRQARYIEAAVDGVLVASIYLPNGNPHPGPKFDYKMAWFDRLIAHAGGLLKAGVPVALVGDYNVVPTEFDIYKKHSYARNALLQPAPREAYRRLLAQGWTDALRTLRPDDPTFTFWSFEFDRFRTDHGMRLDHFLLSPDLAARLEASGVDRETRGKPLASDHAPAWVEIADG